MEPKRIRTRINANRVCSTDNYRASRTAHLEMLKENREAIKELLESIKESHPIYGCRILGKFVECDPKIVKLAEFELITL